MGPTGLLFLLAEQKSLISPVIINVVTVLYDDIIGFVIPFVEFFPLKFDILGRIKQLKTIAKIKIYVVFLMFL